GDLRQQVYSGSAFGTGVITITQIAFSSTATTAGSSSANLTIGLSTTSLIPSNLSPSGITPSTLSSATPANRGSDFLVVASGPITVTTTPGQGLPRDFDFIIPLAVPFIYDPAAGNLLLDITYNSMPPSFIGLFGDQSSFPVTSAALATSSPFLNSGTTVGSSTVKR